MRNLNYEKLKNLLPLAVFLGSYLGLTTNGTYLPREVQKHIFGYKNEYRIDKDYDGKIDEIILTNKDGGALIYRKTGVFFPEYYWAGIGWGFTEESMKKYPINTK